MNCTRHEPKSTGIHNVITTDARCQSPMLIGSKHHGRRKVGRSPVSNNSSSRGKMKRRLFGDSHVSSISRDTELLLQPGKDRDAVFLVQGGVDVSE